MPNRGRVIVIAALALAACGTSSPPAAVVTTTAATLTASTTASTAALTTTTVPVADPVVVTTTADTAKKVSASLGPKGGHLKATGADGTTFDLYVPPKALTTTTALTLTPLTAVGGLLPGTTLAFGATFAPDGLVFTRPAWLTVTPATAVRVDAGLAIQRSAGGVASLRPIGRDGNTYVLAVPHFSGTGGVGAPGGLGGWGPHLPGPGLGNGPQGSAIDHGGPIDLGGRGGGGGLDQGWPHDWPPPPGGTGDSGSGTGSGTGPSLTDGLGSGTPTSGQPSLQDDISSWADEAANAQLSGDEAGQKQADADLGKLQQRVRDGVDAEAKACIDAKDITHLKKLLGLESIAQWLGADDPKGEQDYEAALWKACARLDMQVSGELIFDAKPVFHIGDRLTVDVPLEFQGNGWSNEGVTTTLEAIGYDRGAELLELLGQGLGAMMGINVPNDITKTDLMSCATTPPKVTIGGVLAGLFTDAGPKLSVSFATTSEASVACQGIPAFPLPPFSTDHDTLSGLGIAEAQEPGLLIEHFDAKGDPLPLSRALHASMTDQGATVTTDWTITVKHSPAPMPTR